MSSNCPPLTRAGRDRAHRVRLAPAAANSKRAFLAASRCIFGDCLRRAAQAAAEAAPPPGTGTFRRTCVMENISTRTTGRAQVTALWVLAFGKASHCIDRYGREPFLKRAAALAHVAILAQVLASRRASFTSGGQRSLHNGAASPPTRPARRVPPMGAVPSEGLGPTGAPSGVVPSEDLGPTGTLKIGRAHV